MAFQHCSDDDPETRPLLLVTASVDRIRLARSIRMDADLAVTAKVIWVGRSSMEIQIRLDQPSPSGDSSGKPIPNPSFLAWRRALCQDLSSVLFCFLCLYDHLTHHLQEPHHRQGGQLRSGIGRDLLALTGKLVRFLILSFDFV